MENHDEIDGQMLGSFVDGLLDPEHSEAIIKAMHENPEIREQVYQLRRAKDLMRLGFGEARTPNIETEQSPPVRSLFSARMAASIAALVISFGAGALGHLYFEKSLAGNNVQLAENLQFQSSKIILHVSQSDPDQFDAALAYTENFLEEHDATHEIDVVAHASGLDIMRADVSPVRDRILSLMKRYDNVHFIGCAGAISMYTREHGTPPLIIDGVTTASTAFDHIVNRLQGGGWRYIKVEALPEA